MRTPLPTLPALSIPSIGAASLHSPAFLQRPIALGSLPTSLHPHALHRSPRISRRAPITPDFSSSSSSCEFQKPLLLLPPTSHGNSSASSPPRAAVRPRAGGLSPSSSKTGVPISTITPKWTPPSTYSAHKCISPSCIPARPASLCTFFAAFPPVFSPSVRGFSSLRPSFTHTTYVLCFDRIMFRSTVTFCLKKVFRSSKFRSGGHARLLREETVRKHQVDFKGGR